MAGGMTGLFIVVAVLLAMLSLACLVMATYGLRIIRRKARVGFREADDRYTVVLFVGLGFGFAALAAGAASIP